MYNYIHICTCTYWCIYRSSSKGPAPKAQQANLSHPYATHSVHRRGETVKKGPKSLRRLTTFTGFINSILIDYLELVQKQHMSYVIQGKRKLIIPTSTSDQKEVSYIFGSRSSRSRTIPFHNHEFVKFLELIFSGCFSWSKFSPCKWLIPPNWKKTNKMKEFSQDTLFIYFD